MYYDVSIEISSIPGKTALLRKKDVTYVQLETGRTYNPQKKYNVPSRKIIGKLTANPAYMHPNDTFFAWFPDFDTGSDDSGPVRSSCMQTGLFLAIRRIVKKDGIEKKLYSTFRNDSGLILDLAACQLLNENSNAAYYSSYVYRHPLFADRMQIYSDSALRSFLRGIGQGDVEDFLDSWNAGRDHRQRICVSFNCADKTYRPGDTRLAEKSSWQDSGFQFHNTALAYAATDKMPLFYDEYAGSVTDAIRLDDLCSRIKAYRYKNICFVLDRGDITHDILRYIDENGYSFIMMASGCSPLFTTVSSDPEACIKELRTDKESLIEDNLYGMTVTRKLPDGGKERYVHIYCNTAEQEIERIEFDAILSHMAEQLNGLKGYAVPVSSQYTEYFACSYDSESKLISVDKKEDAVRKRLALCGYFCLITSEKMTAADAWHLYKGRELSENFFCTDKYLPDPETTDFCSDDAMPAKFLAGFIALIIKSRIRLLLQKKRPGQDKTEKAMDVRDAVSELDRIEMLRRNDGRYSLDSALTKKQKEVLLRLGLKMEDVKADAAGISALLKNAAAKIYTNEEEDNPFWL